MVEVGLLIEEAREDDEGRHSVQDREHADADHELLEFIRLGAVMLHDRANAEQGHETGQEKHCAQHQIHEQGRQDEPSQCVDVPQTHVTHTTQDVSCNNKTSKSLLAYFA